MLIWEDIPKKSPKKLKQQLEKGLTCTVEGCNSPLTQKTGPGQNLLCRAHQKNLREFGGTGRIDRPHTHHRTWICVKCSKDAREEVRKNYLHIEEQDPALFSRLCRNRVVGDHIIRKADGGDDSPENIQTLCLECNSDKTILEDDWRNKDCIQEVQILLSH